jgi:hypothetical protein
MKTHPEAPARIGPGAMHCRQAETRAEPSALIDKYPAYRKRGGTEALAFTRRGACGMDYESVPLRMESSSVGRDTRR